MIIGKASEVLPGQIKMFDVNGRVISVANSDGDFYAFDDECTHQACSLEDEGEVDGTELTCLCHLTVFDLTSGEVLGGPAADPLPIFEVSVTGDDLDLSV